MPSFARFLQGQWQKRVADRETRLLLGNTLWMIIDRVIRLGLGLGVGIIVARYLGPTRFGQLSYAITFVGLAGSISALGIESIVVRDLILEPGRHGEIIGTAFALRLVSGALLALSVSAVIFLLRPDAPSLHWLVAITATTLIIQAFDVLDFWFQSQVAIKYSVIAKSIAFLCIALTKVALVYRHAALISFAWAGLAEVLLGAVGLILAGKLTGFSIGQWSLSASRGRQLIESSWPLLLSGIAIGIYMKIDVIMLGAMAGDDAVGVYNVATRISEVWYFIPAAIATSLAPAITAAKQQSEELYYARITRLFHLLSACALVIALPMTFFSRTFIGILYGPSYFAAAPILAVHIWAAVFVFLGVGQNSWTINEGLTKLALWRTIVGAGMNILLNLILIPRYGGLGAAYATVVSYAAAAVFMNASDRRTRGIFRRQIDALFLKDYLSRNG